MTEEQIEEAEKLLGYYEIHLASDAPHPAGDPHRGWNHEEMAALLRDLLPEWSAFSLDAPT